MIWLLLMEEIIVIESFYFGKPIIIIPLFVDQFDNTQRVHEKRFGLRLNPHQCTRHGLTNAIVNLIYDSQLACRMKLIAQRIQNQVKLGKVGKLIENLVIQFDKI